MYEILSDFQAMCVVENSFNNSGFLDKNSDNLINYRKRIPIRTCKASK